MVALTLFLAGTVAGVPRAGRMKMVLLERRTPAVVVVGQM